MPDELYAQQEERIAKWMGWRTEPDWIVWECDTPAGPDLVAKFNLPFRRAEWVGPMLERACADPADGTEPCWIHYIGKNAKGVWQCEFDSRPWHQKTVKGKGDTLAAAVRQAVLNLIARHGKESE